MENIDNKQGNKNKRKNKRVKNNILLDNIRFAFADNFSEKVTEEVTDFFDPTNISRIMEGAGEKGYNSGQVLKL